MVVIASEDVGLADNTMLPLATAAYAAAEKIGMPEARINLAHVAVALSLSKKSTRAYRGLENAIAALQVPGVAGLPVPTHLRNAPTRLMKEMGYGKEWVMLLCGLISRIGKSNLKTDTSIIPATKMGR